ASKTIKVKFCPTSTGSKSATLYADGTNCNDDSSSLSGTGYTIGPIELIPASYDFGNVQVGQCSSEYTFTLTNTGGGTATGSVSLTGTHADQFTITQGSGSFSLGAGASKTIKVKFCPTSTGSKSATLYADGTNCNDDSSSLSGTGYTIGPIELIPASYDFGNVQVGQCSSEYTFTLTNTGGGTATGSVSLTGTHADQFTITQGSGSFSLGAGASKTIKVKFCPTSTGSKSATLYADGTNCNDDSSSLSGTGYTIGPIELIPASYDFGNVQVGQCSSEYTFTLTNTGGGTATGSVSLTGTHADQFTITQGSGSFSLGAGASKTIKVKFCPTSTGSKSATLFADGSNCNDDSSPLSGTGTPENEPPIASFTYSPERPVVNQTVTFDASSSYDPDGTIVKYKWDFGDGNITSLTNDIITHSYPSVGLYSVRLTVTDDGGLANSTSKTVTVSEEISELTTITVEPETASVAVGSTQQFTATACDQYGNPMAGITISWTSTNTTVGTVSPSSVVTGADGTATTTFTALAEGTTYVIAGNQSLTDTATVVVSEIVGALVSISDASANTGETVTVPINITDVTNLGAASIWLSYDKDVVIVDSVSDGDLGSVTSAIDNTAGVTKMIWFSATGKTGDFVFAYATLKAVGSAGQTSPLDLDVKKLSDASGNPIPHTVKDGVFEIVTAPAPKSANATRDIEKQTLAPGESTNITVTITNNVTQALVLDEDIPAGWTLTRMSDDASTFHTTKYQWLWMTVNAGETKTVIYRLTVPNSAAAGDYSVSGSINNASGIIDTVKGEDTITVAPDTTPPTIISVSPADGATDVAVSTTISATFSEAMNTAASVEAAFSIAPSVAGTFSWAGNTMTFTPGANLAYITIYTVTIGTGAQDLAGNPLTSAYTWSFTTTSAPSVLTSIIVSPSTARLNIGDTQLFTATAYDQFGGTMAGVVITWRSLNTTVGTVTPVSAITSADGTATTNFTAFAEGATNIIVRNGTVYDQATVTVSEEGIPNISWNMTISATNQLEPVVVGMHPNATDGYDPEYDIFAQTPVQGKVILILDNIYSKSIKKTRCYNESVSWNLSVGVPTGQTTTLSWDVPSNVNLTIFEGDEVLSSGSQLGEGGHELTVTAELLEYQEYCIDLKAGWNMVSLPLIPDNCSVDAIFGSIPTLDTMPVVTWESPSFVKVGEVEPKIGYWVFTPADTTISVTGKSITNTTLILEAGWNMVGTVGMENLSISDIPNQVPQRPAVTWVAPSFVETDIIEPGRSAWVFVTMDTVVTVGKAISTEVKAKTVPTVMKIKSAEILTTGGWNLSISATNQLEPVTFGLHPNATDGYDSGYDTFVQTPIQGKVILILDDIYATEINRERMAWNLSVGVPTGETTTLTWDPSRTPTDVILTLDGIDMKLQSSIELGEGSHSFVISGSIVEPGGVFDTGRPTNPYPSIMGTHTGTITPNQTITVTKLYTYPCAGTGGHTESIKLYENETLIASGTWNGYVGDWHNTTFDKTGVLLANKTYNYTIRTGSYPQIHHTPSLPTANGWINCTSFIDANGKRYNDWIPAIRLE
ncbi:MAG: choice-of-anchor D domain-containing protein, partial [archaeon]|nr:choice-of-anchor D domain-containing protein [archaeon]